MNKIIPNLRKLLKKNLTIIFVPHTTISTKKITFSLSFLVFLVFLWTGITIWAGYISSKHFDYWRLKIDKEIIKLKFLFFTDQIKKSQELLEEVREKDEQLRQLLEMKTKKDIITNNAKGGPSELEKKYFEKYLENKIEELNLTDLRYQTNAIRQKAKQILISTVEIENFINYQKTFYTATPNIYPCTGAFTSLFGFRKHPITHRYEFHSGLDICNLKKTPVVATADGTVKLVNLVSGYGKLIIIDHGMGYQTYYAHLYKQLVNQGQKVLRGQIIGLMGETGTTTGVHLHYEVVFNNKVVNPIKYLDKDNFFVERR